jgi:hypothetical protein
MRSVAQVDTSMASAAGCLPEPVRARARLSALSLTCVSRVRFTATLSATRRCRPSTSPTAALRRVRSGVCTCVCVTARRLAHDEPSRNRGSALHCLGGVACVVGGEPSTSLCCGLTLLRLIRASHKRLATPMSLTSGIHRSIASSKCTAIRFCDRL